MRLPSPLVIRHALQRLAQACHLLVKFPQQLFFLRHECAPYLLVSASTPGSFLPSRNSSEAPPPVEMCVILSATPACFTALTLSPPPTMEVAPALSVTACAIAVVPLANCGNSNTPIGPFHTMVRAREISSANFSTDFGPMSSAIMSAGIGSPSPMLRAFAAASNLAATT